MFDFLFGMYKPNFARIIVYMLQSTEYQVGPYIAWFWRTSHFGRVMHRRTLVMTMPAKLLLAAMRAGLVIQYSVAILLGILAIANGINGLLQLAIAVFLITPVLWAHLIVLPLLLGRLIITPYYDLKIRRSAALFAKHKATKIAVAGSYGKTTMKEILLTVLGSGKKTAATPANKNVAISQALFAESLEGDEEILIIEFGEGAPGDVKAFSRRVKPDVAVITGLAPAHLDKYKTLEAAGRDIFSLADYLHDKNVYVNVESSALEPFIKKKHTVYGLSKLDGWRIDNIKVGPDGLKFNMKKGQRILRLACGLVGRHQVGSVALAVILADKYGMKDKEIEKAVAKIQPYEHRMQPRRVSGAWLIDDTYNGNIEGMKAGLELLKELKAKRKIYVTPGLVDQGKESPAIHRELGQIIAKAKPDIVILMKHSVTAWIEEGLKAGGYKSDLRIEDDPLHFYNNLDQFIAAGDVVLMQNDWPDQYN